MFHFCHLFRPVGLGKILRRNISGASTRVARVALVALPGALLPLTVDAVTLAGAQLAALAPGSASASFSSPDLPALVLTVTDTTGATMQGSDLDSYEGLWLGSQGNGGRYTLGFNQPLQSLTVSFIALTALPPDAAESLLAFEGDRALSVRFASADGSAAWDGRTLSPLEEDSRATLQFNALDGAGFSSLSFVHLQPAPLQGVVVDRIDFLPALVPESSSALMLLLGGAALALQARRLAQHRAHAESSV